eukprot:CAMPEP_0202903388 /NCGR_PEP_ID=MMETSP1392-20130828/24194_1 /ASSEMBLY_ACC=CAM_ASM_000868 /TAXON_ID=225041 /ORGANISM="Chlamydomonas chlamydogama, Strain SAG 11-48b" /LENGTH=58 /DNA_ID=CAMNT_0049590537 /DNA_START=273 /DNA_END=447 /DNA_ORIENTATION=+
MCMGAHVPVQVRGGKAPAPADCPPQACPAPWSDKWPAGPATAAAASPSAAAAASLLYS